MHIFWKWLMNHNKTLAQGTPRVSEEPVGACPPIGVCRQGFTGSPVMLTSRVDWPELQRPDTWANATLEVSVRCFGGRVAVKSVDSREADCPPVVVGRAQSGDGLQSTEGRPGRRRAMLPLDPWGSPAHSLRTPTVVLSWVPTQPTGSPSDFRVHTPEPFPSNQPLSLCIYIPSAWFSGDSSLIQVPV